MIQLHYAELSGVFIRFLHNKKPGSQSTEDGAGFWKLIAFVIACSKPLSEDDAGVG